MKRLVIKVFIFVTLGMLMLTPLCLNFRGVASRLPNDKLFHFDKRITTVIMGDSHTETGLDPSLLPNSLSMAKSAENYFYTYYKLKLVLSVNPQIRNVILGFSYHNIAKTYQEEFLFDDKAHVCEFYFPIVDDYGRDILRKQGTGYLLKLLKYDLGFPIQLYRNSVIYKLAIGLPLKKKDILFFGGYSYNDRHKISTELTRKKIFSYYFDERGCTGISSIMQDYLNKIIELCNGKGVKVYLVNLPLHADYRRMVPSNAVLRFHELGKNLEKKYSNLKIIDWSSMALEDHMFYDGDHINVNGAAITTKRLAKEIIGIL